MLAALPDFCRGFWRGLDISLLQIDTGFPPVRI
jgi:hypothetical protein